jgi:hypothetical protein
MKREVGIFIGKQSTISSGTCDYTFILRSNGQTQGSVLQVITSAGVIHTLNWNYTGNTINEVSQVISLNSGVQQIIWWYWPGQYMANVGLKILDPLGTLIYELPFGSNWIGQQQLYVFTPNCSAILGKLDYFKLELFKDEKINVSLTSQNISDISKIYSEFSQSFTVPASTINNQILEHFYENTIEHIIPPNTVSIDYQLKSKAYIEIDTILFRDGVLTFEKANYKNNRPYSYTLTFFGAGVNLKTKFAEDKLNQLDYSSINHIYNTTQVYNRITTATIDYDVCYPLISSKRLWQIGAQTPTNDTPDWYTYPTSGINDISTGFGPIKHTELFPAVRVASIFNLIEQKYLITFEGAFLTSDNFTNLYLYYKNATEFKEPNASVAVALLQQNHSGVGDAFFGNFLNYLYGSTHVFRYQPLVDYPNTTYTQTLSIAVIGLSVSPNVYYIDIYKNNNYFFTYTNDVVFPIDTFIIPLDNAGYGDYYSFVFRSTVACTANLHFQYKNVANISGTIYTSFGTNIMSVTTSGLMALENYAPDMKIIDFITGICNQFNLTIYSLKKDYFTFQNIIDWYISGKTYDITNYVNTDAIELEKVKLYKSIEFKFADSESFMNKQFLQNQSNPKALGYGDARSEFNYDGPDYKIQLPFENLLQNNFGNGLQVGYCLNKEFTAYIPKPILLYKYGLTTINGSIEYLNKPTITKYMLFGQETVAISSAQPTDISINFGAEISTISNQVNLNTAYRLYYESYLQNLYDNKNRLTKLKTILPLSILINIKLNDLLIIRDKRYQINEMQVDLITGEVSFTLLNYLALVKPTYLPIERKAPENRE